MNNKYIPFLREYDNFIAKYLVPKAIAYYLITAKKRRCLVNTTLKNHIGSALDSFNIECNIDELIPIINNILNKKYNVKIIQDNPLILGKNNKKTLS